VGRVENEWAASGQAETSRHVWSVISYQFIYQSSNPRGTYVTALYGNNASRAKNVGEPATSTRLTVNCRLRSRNIVHVH